MADNVRSVDRIVDLMEIVDEERYAVSLTELASRSSLRTKTVFRLMWTLGKRG